MRIGLKRSPLGLWALLLTLVGLTSAAAAPKAPRKPISPELYRKMLQFEPTSVSAIREHVKFLRENGLPRADYWEGYLYRYQQRAYPFDRVDFSLYDRANAQRDRMKPARLGGGGGLLPANGSGNRWEFVGPNNLPVPYRIYYGEGATSGRVNAVAYDPANPSVYWLGASSGGLFKSTNSGQSWTHLSSAWSSQQISAIAVHPTNPNVVYVGTGDYHGIGQNYPFGIMKSLDGGQTWTNLARTDVAGGAVSDIVIDPENPDIVTITSGRGNQFKNATGRVLRSTNGGQSWTTVISGAGWSGLNLGPRDAGNNNRRRMYAVGEFTAGGEIMRSDDRGATWTKLTSPLSNGRQEGLDIAPSLTKPDSVYLLSGLDQKIFKSIDAGANWTDISGGFPNDNGDGSRLNWLQSNYDFHITTSTRADNGNDVIYVGLLDLAQSRDEGSTWQSVGQTLTNNALTHNDQHSMAINPANPNEALVGNDGGVYRFTYNPTSNTWAFNTTLSKTLGITEFYEADWHPTDPDRMIGGSQDNATPTSLGDLANWRNVGAGDGGGCAINPQNPNIQYCTNYFYNPVFRTINQWSTSNNIAQNYGNDIVPFIGQLTVDPSNGNLMYIGTDHLWQWNEATLSWRARLGNQKLASGQNYITALAVAKSDGNYIYTGASNGEVWMTQDQGGTWTQISGGAPGLPNRAVTGIAVHPTDPKNVLVAVSGFGTGHLWRLSDSTSPNRAWANLSGAGATGLPDVPANTVAIDPANPGTRYFVGTDVGVFRTANGGSTWENATNPLGLPNVMVTELKIVPGTGYLMAATYGRGMWRIDPDANVIGLSLTSPVGGETLIANVPSTITWSSFGFGANHRVRIELSRDGGLAWETIAADAPDTGSFAWTPNLPTTDRARIRLTSITTPLIVSTSGDFRIVEGSLRVVAPNGGEGLVTDQETTIRWQATGFAGTLGTVRVELSRDNGSTWETLFDATQNDGAEDWTVVGPTTDTALIRITAVDAPVFTDRSDSPFDIREPSTLVLTSPNGGEQLVVGENVDIAWTSTGFRGGVKVELSRDAGRTWEVLFPDASNVTKRATWRVTGPATRAARIRVSSVTEPTTEDVSNGVFEIAVPSIQVTAPVGGRTLLIGQNEEVRFTTTGIRPDQNVKIEISRDGGETWTTLSDGTPNTGSFRFDVAGPESANTVLRVSSVDDPSVNAVSASFFLSAPTLFVVNPNGGERWKLGNQHRINWSGTTVGSGTVDIQISYNNGRTWKTIIEDTPNDGSEAWGVHGTTSTKAKIRVVWNTDPTVSDESNRKFTTLKPRAKGTRRR